MSDPYERVKGSRLSFKGGTLASRSKAIDKKKKKKKHKNKDSNIGDDLDGVEIEIDPSVLDQEADAAAAADGGPSGEIYTIDAAKRMKYEQLFPVEAKKFGYQPKTDFKSIEDALDDRVKKKADRYCK